jgi:hypothetical protein
MSTEPNMKQLVADANAALKKPRAKRAAKPFGEVKGTTVRHFPTQATNTNLIISKAPPKTKAPKEPKAPKEKKVATTTPKVAKPRAPRKKKDPVAALTSVAITANAPPGEVKIEKKPRKKADPTAPKKPRGKIPADQVKCMKCKKNVSCAGCQVVDAAGGKKRLAGKCPECGTGVTKFVSKDYVKP